MPKPTASNHWWPILRFVGAVLLIATGVIHLNLYLTGYRTIPTIGWLFLLQVISDFALAIVLVRSRGRLIAVAAALLVYATLLGYLVALRVSLFGFREVRTSAGVVAGLIEIAAFAALAAFALRPVRLDRRRSISRSSRFDVANQRTLLLVGRWVAAVLVLQAALSLGLLVAKANGGSTNSNGAEALVKVAKVHGTAVLTNARGYTLYWFAPDTSTTSSCYSTCAAYWPPVLGTPTPKPGTIGTFATMQRTGGATQATYDGHPLYTYVGDSAPGQASGNRIKLNGGYWYEMKVAK